MIRRGGSIAEFRHAVADALKDTRISAREQASRRMIATGSIDDTFVCTCKRGSFRLLIGGAACGFNVERLAHRISISASR